MNRALKDILSTGWDFCKVGFTVFAGFYLVGVITIRPFPNERITGMTRQDYATSVGKSLDAYVVIPLQAERNINRACLENLLWIVPKGAEFVVEHKPGVQDCSGIALVPNDHFRKRKHY